jgi:adenosylhomocysteine nucleosidase
MIAVTFALPQESRVFRGALHHAGRGGVAPAEYLIGNIGAEEVIVLHTGVGDEAATRRTETLLAAVKPRYLIAAGFAGALDRRLRVGDLVIATNVSGRELRDRASALLDGEPGVFFGPVVGSQIPVEEVSEKAALGRMSQGIAVDMETASVAGASARVGVPFLAVRAISDAADQSLPVPFAECFDLDRQRPRPLALLRFLRRHPRRIIPFMRFVHGLHPCAAALADFLVRFINAGG